MFKQNNKGIPIIFLLTLIVGFLLTFLYANEFLSTAFVTADTVTVPFLRSPYYENPSITSFMDHKYPTYNFDPNDDFPEMVRYDGQTWPQAPVSNCNQGVNCYDGHDGSDFATGLSFQVLAAATGTIVFADWFNVNDHNAGFGMLVDIDHGNGYRTQYGHLSAITYGIDPPVPQPVNAGHQIGTSGETGNSTGKHLHFTVLRNGVEVDPYGWSPVNPTTTPDPWKDYTGVEST